MLEKNGLTCNSIASFLRSGSQFGQRRLRRLTGRVKITEGVEPGRGSAAFRSFIIGPFAEFSCQNLHHIPAWIFCFSATKASRWVLARRPATFTA